MIPLGVLASARVAPSVGGPIVSDSFNRADGPLGSTDTGHPWVYIGHAGPWVVLGNRCRAAIGTTDEPSTVVDFGSPDMSVSVDILDVSGSVYSRVVARASTAAPTTLYRAEIAAGNGGVYVGRTVGGSRVWIGSNVTPAIVGRYTLTTQEGPGGTNLSLRVDGVLKWSYVDTFAGRPSGTYGGLAQRAASANARFDNFSIETP